MKKLILVILSLSLVFIVGCAGFFKAVEDKQVNLDFQVYGFRILAYDPITGTFSPTGEFGFGSTVYRSIPIKAGQPFYAKYVVKSLWSSDPASETTIWIGRAHQESVLEFEAVPIGMMVISKNGIVVGPDASLKLTPIGPLKE